MALVVSVPIPLRTQRARAAQEVRGTSDLRGPEWNVDPRDAKRFYGITENKKSANEHLTHTEGVLGLRTVEKRGILLEDLTHYNNE